MWYFGPQNMGRPALSNRKKCQLGLRNVRAVVNGERLPHSLLGITALERLSGYEVRDGTLTLRP